MKLARIARVPPIAAIGVSDGVSRLIRHVDIGCFECTTGGLMLMVK